MEKRKLRKENVINGLSVLAIASLSAVVLGLSYNELTKDSKDFKEFKDEVALADLVEEEYYNLKYSPDKYIKTSKLENWIDNNYVFNNDVFDETDYVTPEEIEKKYEILNYTTNAALIKMINSFDVDDICKNILLSSVSSDMDQYEKELIIKAFYSDNKNDIYDAIDYVLNKKSDEEKNIESEDDIEFIDVSLNEPEYINTKVKTLYDGENTIDENRKLYTFVDYNEKNADYNFYKSTSYLDKKNNCYGIIYLIADKNGNLLSCLKESYGHINNTEYEYINLKDRDLAFGNLEDFMSDNLICIPDIDFLFTEDELETLNQAYNNVSGPKR